MGEDGIRSGFNVVKLPADYSSCAVERPLSSCRIATSLLVNGLTTFVALTVVVICQRTANRFMQHLPEIALVAAVWSIIGAMRVMQASYIDPSRRPIAIIGLSLLHFLANCAAVAIFHIFLLVAWGLFLASLLYGANHHSVPVICF